MSGSHAHMLSWPLLLAVVVVIAELVYLRGWLSLRSAFPDLIGSLRLAAFTAGLASVWIAVASPLATLDHQSLTIHMMKPVSYTHLDVYKRQIIDCFINSGFHLLQVCR